MHFNRRCNKTKNTYGSHMKANVKENTILMCLKNRATSHDAKKSPCLGHHIKYFQIRVTNQARKHTQLKHFITEKVPVCISSDDLTKQKKSYGSYIKANLKEKTILMGSKKRAISHQLKKILMAILSKKDQVRVANQERKHTQLNHCIT